MGIQHLNKFLKEECKDSIQFISLAELSGKKIAVDVSIYLYKYATDDGLIENFYLMLAVFRHYNIIPIFVFDGKPPTEKKALLCERLEKKKSAQEEYNKLKEELAKRDGNDADKQDILATMDTLKKRFITICKTQIEEVKQLIRACGASYYHAPGEADELCAKLVLKGKVWACLSEDMDMFVYGVGRVIRYLSLLNHTAVLYNMESILKTLNMSQKEFREICVLSGTDYNVKSTKTTNLKKTLSYFKTYKQEREEQQQKQFDDNDDRPGFYSWLYKNTTYVSEEKDDQQLSKINSMFQLLENEENDDDDSEKLFASIPDGNGEILEEALQTILKKDGFIFPYNKY